MTLWEAALLGLIQGLTEFLPVSSSGHLVIFQDLLGLDEPGVTLEVLLHFGTLFSVLWVFGKDFQALMDYRKDRQQRYFLFMLFVGLIVTGMIGLFFSTFVGLLFKSTLLVGIMLLLTGGILKILTIIPIGKKSIEDMKAGDAVWIGLLQGFAVLPGISRSGSTIMAALWRGLDRETAVKYSFMLAAPVIFGAALLELKEMIVLGIERVMILNYFVGGLVAFLAGVTAIKVFIRLLLRQKFHYFAYYCWSVGSLVIIVSLLRQ
ncbi:MAG: undecaprenyl-diphosphate phosphatase [Bacillota bacterium]